MSEPARVDPAPAETTCYRHPDRRAGVRCQRCERPICPSCMTTASVGFHCPECARGGSQKVYTRVTLQRLHRPVVTQVLIAINAAVYVAGMVLDEDGGAWSREGGLFGPDVADGEWWRIVTAGFLHSPSVFHILFNMLVLWNLAQILEPALGRLRFGLLYGVSLLTGSLGVLILSPNALTVGASGAVYGLLGALFVLQRAKGIDPWSSGLGGLLVINLLITFAIPRISIGGHLGGLVGGFVVAWILLEGPRVLPRWAPPAVVGALGIAVFGACLAVASAS